MKVLVCGGRDFTDKTFVYGVLDGLHRARMIDVIIEGDATGPDRMAGYWARKNHIADLKFRADWQKHGRAAGPIRNKQMLDEGKPDMVLAFPGGRGTANMVKQAQSSGFEVVQVG